MQFAHLHVHSHYSLLDGLIKIDELIERTKEYNMEAVALTDHGVMYGAVEFYQKAKEAGIKPLVGVEAYLVDGSRFDKTKQARFHLVLIAKNKTGYNNLLQLTTLAHLEGYYYKPRIDWEILEKYSEGLVALSACLQGEIPQAYLEGGLEKARNVLKKYLNLFGDDFYLELQRHNNLKDQDKVNEGIIALSREMGVPLVATNDAHYLDLKDERAQDVLLCLQTKKKQKDRDRMIMLGMDNSFKSPQEMEELFYDIKEAVSNTHEIVKKCNLEIELGKIHLPKFDLPENLTAEEYLRELCKKGLSKRYPQYFTKNNLSEEEKKERDKTKERLEYELGVIEKTGFASYFLIVQDFVNWAKNKGIVVGPGRGSAAGSLVSYLLNITNIDPLKYDLLFERFLNPDRISMPDIDLDFADTRRDEVIRYVEGKYGRDKVAQIITFGTMAARAAVRDAGRVLDYSYDYCDKLAKMIPMFTPLKKAIEEVAELREIYNTDKDAKRILDTALRLEGVARHASTHACAVLITKDPLVKNVPLQYASSGDRTIVSQYSMKPVEALGLLKMDFLGLRNLTIIENALQIIKNTKGVKIDIENIPLDDKKTYELFSRGDTTGVFQFESSGMRRYLKRLKPTVFEDVIAMVALYRPGPLNSGMIDEFIDRKHGRKPIVYRHPIMKNALRNTYGVIVYQEQVMQLSRDMAGFTGGQADTLRKAMGKKIAALMAKMKADFIKGCIKNKIDEKLAKDTFSDMEKFAEYGFNKSHATCYARIGYETAYLKANYPVEFMAALLSANEGDVDKVALDVAECKKMGIEVLPPDINESFEHFTVVPLEEEEKNKTGKIRFGLLTIKNVGKNVVEEIIKERKKNGPFADLSDFLLRIKSKDLNKKSLESLIKCGALDKFGDRNKLLFNLERILQFIKETRDQSNSRQGNLLNMIADDYRPHLELEEIEKSQMVSEKEKLSWEKELLGLYISDHPFVKYLPYLEGKIVPLHRLIKEEEGKSVVTAGVISKIHRIVTKKGETMFFVKIEDASMGLEVLVFPRLLEETKSLWEEEKIILLKGRFSSKDGEPKVIAEKALELQKERIDEALLEMEKNNRNGWARNNHQNGYNNGYSSKEETSSPNHPSYLDVKVPATIKRKTLEKLKDFFSHYKGEVFVRFVVDTGGVAKIIKTSFSLPKEKFKEIKKEVENILNS